MDFGNPESQEVRADRILQSRNHKHVEDLANPEVVTVLLYVDTRIFHPTTQAIVDCFEAYYNGSYTEDLKSIKPACSSRKLMKITTYHSNSKETITDEGSAFVFNPVNYASGNQDGTEDAEGSD